MSGRRYTAKFGEGQPEVNVEESQDIKSSYFANKDYVDERFVAMADALGAVGSLFGIGNNDVSVASFGDGMVKNLVNQTFRQKLKDALDRLEKLAQEAGEDR